MNKIPLGLESCDPRERIFPLSWKEAYFRRFFNKKVSGYICPICKQVFRGNKGFRQLRCDHIKPYARGGLTIWENLQLLCVQCNLDKSDR